MIPKIIHYVWGGGNPKPDLVLDCIASWKKHLPDYDIIEWNDEKHEAIKVPFSEQAAKWKKWGFVSDYLRYYALYNYGGFYIDSDVEVKASLEAFRRHDFVAAADNYHGLIYPVCTAMMGSAKGGRIAKNMLDYYVTHDFELPMGLNMEASNKKIAKYLAETYNLQPPYEGDTVIELGDNSVLYPWWYFCIPKDGEENYTEHHFLESWADAYFRKDKIRVGKYILTRFRKWCGEENRPLPISDEEKILCRLPVSKTKQYVLIKRG